MLIVGDATVRVMIGNVVMVLGAETFVVMAPPRRAVAVTRREQGVMQR